MIKKPISLALILLAALSSALMPGCKTEKNEAPDVIVYEKNICQSETFETKTGFEGAFIYTAVRVFTREPEAKIELIDYSGDKISGMRTITSTKDEDPLIDYYYRGYYYNTLAVLFYAEGYPFSVNSMTYSVNGEEHTAVFDPPLCCEQVPEIAEGPIGFGSGYGVSTSSAFDSAIPAYRYKVHKDAIILGFDMNRYAHVKDAHIKGYNESNELIFEGELDEMLPLSVSSGTWFDIRFGCEFDENTAADRYMYCRLETKLNYSDAETGEELCETRSLTLQGVCSPDEIQALLDTKLAELGIEKPAE